MSLIKSYSDGLSEIEIYDDHKLHDEELDELLTEIYDLCNEIARNENFDEKAIKKHFYIDEKPENKGNNRSAID